ncbi:unnamed protein product [Phyllotreta striolata]|uniref:Uncharacterized protein n=1 Tax=Phyllotreta striolata TaxID=444603 RepID=A0A9N9TT94_PHYSR|nr:unnamed protein product [Phyllotreta striolata]
MASAITRIKAHVRDFRRKAYGPNIWSGNQKQRAILKDGQYNILKPKFPRRYLRYVKDSFTSLVDSEWKWTVQAMVLGFTGMWLLFALLWWLIAFVHKDLHDEHMPAKQAENGIMRHLYRSYFNEFYLGWTPCVLNIYGFHSCFLYSLETQSTIGYGSRAVTEECPEAIFLLCAQIIIGMIIDSFTVGVFLAKLMRPKLTAYTIQFSRNAVVCLQDGVFCLMMRVGDLRKNKLIGVSIKAFFIDSATTKEGEKLDPYETELRVQCDDAGGEPIFLWPVTVMHKINEDSPLYRYSSSDILNKKFEIVLMLDGTIESTGQGTNAITSYLSNEILWGQKFEKMIGYNKKLESFEVDFKCFDSVKTAYTPSCSPAEFDECKKDFYEKFGHNEDDQEKKEIITDNRKAPSRSETPPFPDIWV